MFQLTITRDSVDKNPMRLERTSRWSNIDGPLLLRITQFSVRLVPSVSHIHIRYHILREKVKKKRSGTCPIGDTAIN